MTFLTTLRFEQPPPLPEPQVVTNAEPVQSHLPTVSVWRLVGSTYEWVGDVATYESVACELRHLDAGSWSLRLLYDDQAKMITKDRLVTIEYRGIRFTGLVEKLSPQSDEQGTPVLEASGTGALALLSDVLCWPDPTSAANAQLTTRYRARGPAETVLRDLILANVVTRRGDAVTIPASQGRGGTVTVNLFFKNLFAVVQAKARAAGLGVRMGLVNTTSNTRAQMQVEFYVPQNLSSTVWLSHSVGSLAGWKQTDALPGGTSALVAAALEQNPLEVTAVNVAANTLSIPAGSGGHHLQTGSPIRFHGGGTPPAPLSDSTQYFAIRVDANTFRVAKSRARASEGTAIALTSAGSGVIKITEVNRVVRQVTDTAAQAAWGRKREVFVDSRDEDSGDAAVIDERGAEALADLLAESSFELKVVETPTQMFGVHYGISDVVTVELLTGLSTTERIGAARIAASATGVEVEVIPGNPDAANPMFSQAAITRAIQRRLSNLEQEES